MPRLGAGSDHGDASPRRLATAYAAPRNKFNFSNVILLVAFTFILRNIFFHDYRTEEINTLKASGKSAEEISKLVPQSNTERRQTMEERKHEYERLKMDVKNLKDEMEKLKLKVEENMGNSQDEDDANEPADGDDANESEQDGDANGSEALGDVDSEAVTKPRARAVEEKPHKTISNHAVHDAKKATDHEDLSTIEKTSTKKVKTSDTTKKTAVKKRMEVTKTEE